MTLSVLIPARNEPYLAATVADLLAHAVGDLEILPVFDGPPYVSLPSDARVRPIYHEEPHGMRPSINHAASLAQGDYFLKCDAHCSFAPGFDRVLLDEIEPTWVVVPRRYSLDPVSWTILETEPARDAHYLSWPFGPREPEKPPVLRGWSWKQRAKERAHVLLDDEMTSQGSCWVMSRAQWTRIGPLDVEHYGPFIQEFQEVGNKTWLGGGRVVVNKKTHYAHWYKRTGQGYALSRRQSREGIAYSLDHWFYDRPWEGKARSFNWLIGKFWPVPGWPVNWEQMQREGLCPSPHAPREISVAS